MSAPSVENELIIYGICILIFILLLLSLINFINHFMFNYKCPYIIRDLEVAGIYPTLTQVYILISFTILIFVIISKIYDRTYISNPLFIQYSQCYTQFKPYTNSIFDLTFISNGTYPSITDSTALMCRLFIISQFILIYILETYFSFSRYYNVCDITHKYHLSIPFTIYSIIFISLSYISITILPILTLFLCIFHILNITYFSYYFHHTIKDSYKHIFASPDFGQFGHNDTYTAMKIQLKQIHTMSILSTISSFITSYCNYSYILCSNNNILIISILLTINNILLFCQFTKNRIFFKYLFKCKCSSLYNICHMPCDMIIERRLKRKWIRDRQKSIFDRLQSINRPTFNWNWSKQSNSKVKPNVPPPPIHAHSLNNSIDKSNLNLPNDMSMDILDLDIDPNNQILNNASMSDINNPFDTKSNSSMHSQMKNKLPSGSHSKIITARPSLSLQTDSIKSDISDIFTKMRSIGQTFRDKPRHSGLDLVKELAAQIEMNKGRNIRDEIKEKQNKKELKDLNREVNLLKMKEKTNKQISFGADMALEIIKETINTKQTEKKELNNKLVVTQSNDKRKLIDYSSEPPLMSKDKYENKYANMKEENKLDTISDMIQRHSNSQMNLSLDAQILSKSDPLAELNDGEMNDLKRSNTVPNSPDVPTKPSSVQITQSDPINKKNIPSNIQLNGVTDKKVFLYDISNGKNSTENMNSFTELNLTRTQSLITMPKEMDSPTDNKNDMSITPIKTDDIEFEDGSYVVYDWYDNNNNTNIKCDDDIKTPLTPTSTKTPQVIVTTPFDDYDQKGNSNVNNKTIVLDVNRLGGNMNTERSKTKSLMGTLRGIFAPMKGETNRKESMDSTGTKHSRTKSTSTSKLAKINSFLKQNGMTMHHQNVNEVFRNMRFTKRNELEVIDAINEMKVKENNNMGNGNGNVNSNSMRHKKQNTDVMETIVEHIKI